VIHFRIQLLARSAYAKFVRFENASDSIARFVEIAGVKQAVRSQVADKLGFFLKRFHASLRRTGAPMQLVRCE
jgi:hypothetical protein|tara:strand:+ start:77344 stop:77562 length:219 start_codon:yes stop_codon:yes gene_type:complete